MNVTAFKEAQEAYAHGDYARALAGFTVCTQEIGDLSPDDLSKFNHLIGNCYIKNGEPEKAVKYYTEALRTSVRSRRPALLVNLGTALLNAKNYEHALESFESALRYEGYATPYRAYSGIGAVQLKLGNTVEAGAAYREAALDPHNPMPAKALINLGVCFMELGRAGDAIVSYEAALDFGLDEVSTAKVKSNLGQAYMAEGRVPRAIEAFEDALKCQEYELTPMARHDYDIAMKLRDRLDSKVPGILNTGFIPTLQIKSPDELEKPEVDPFAPKSTGSGVAASDAGVSALEEASQSAVVPEEKEAQAETQAETPAEADVCSPADTDEPEHGAEAEAESVAGEEAAAFLPADEAADAIMAEIVGDSGAFAPQVQQEDEPIGGYDEQPGAGGESADAPSSVGVSADDEATIAFAPVDAGDESDASGSGSLSDAGGANGEWAFKTGEISVAGQSGEFEEIFAPGSNRPEVLDFLADDERSTLPSPEDTQFFDIEERAIDQDAKDERKKARKRRGCGLKIAIFIIVLCILLVGAAAVAFVMGYGYPTQETVALEFAQAAAAGQDTSSYWAATSAEDTRDTQAAMLSGTSDASVDAVQRSSTSSTVYVKVTLAEGGQTDYAITMARDGIGWKVAYVDLYFASNN